MSRMITKVEVSQKKRCQGQTHMCPHVGSKDYQTPYTYNTITLKINLHPKCYVN